MISLSWISSCLAEKLCPSITAPANGAISIAGDPILGNIATFNCHAGYQLKGSQKRLCLANGQWSGVQPTCNGKNCTCSTPHHYTCSRPSYYTCSMKTPHTCPITHFYTCSTPQHQTCSIPHHHTCSTPHHYTCSPPHHHTCSTPYQWHEPNTSMIDS